MRAITGKRESNCWYTRDPDMCVAFEGGSNSGGGGGSRGTQRGKKKIKSRRENPNTVPKCLVTG